MQWQEGTEREAASGDGPSTHLAHWLTYIRDPPANDPGCRNVKYADFVEQHTYNKKSGWKLRVARCSDQPVGRMYTVHPSAGEPFYLRILLTHLEGRNLDLSASMDPALRNRSYTFTALRCVPDSEGVPQLCESYQEACVHRGLLADDKEWMETMRSAKLIATNMRAYRELFVSILVYNRPSDASKLFDAFYLSMADDYARQQRLFRGARADDASSDDPSLLRAMVLLDVERRLQSAGESISDDESRALEKHRLVLTDEDRIRATNALHAHVRTATEPRVVRDELDFNREAMETDARERRACAESRPSQKRLLDKVIRALDNPSDASLKRCFLLWDYSDY